jgi:hypothetical protein
MNYKHIMDSAIQRRDTLIKRLNQARAVYDDAKCEQLGLRLQAENEIIYDCKQVLDGRELAILLCQHNRETA